MDGAAWVDGITTRVAAKARAARMAKEYSFMSGVLKFVTSRFVREVRLEDRRLHVTAWQRRDESRETTPSYGDRPLKEVASLGFNERLQSSMAALAVEQAGIQVEGRKTTTRGSLP